MTATKTGSRRLGLSLETRIFLVTSLLIAASVVAAVALTTVLLRRIARNAAVASLERSASVQEVLERRRYGDLQMSSRIFLGNPSLVAYLLERDVPSVVDLLQSSQKELGFDFGILLDPDGGLVARTDRPKASGEDLSGRPLVAEVLEEFQASGVWQEGGRLYYAVAVPVSQDFTVNGFLITGFAIDDKLAEEVNRVSGADVAFVSVAGKEISVAASTLRPETMKTLAASLSETGAVMGAAMREGRGLEQAEVTLDGERWLALLTPLLDAQGQPAGTTVSLASLARELAAFRQIQNVLMGSGLAAVLLAPVLAFAITRRTLAPVKRLVTAASAARQGDYDQKISSERNDEVGQLAHAFSDLLADLREKRDMEVYVTELSRNLPEPREGRAVVGEPQLREVLLCAVELRGQARAAEHDPRAALERLGAELSRVTGALVRKRGTIEGVSGHRVLARFEGDKRGTRALEAAAQILAVSASSAGAGGQDGDGPVIAMAAGKAVTGPVAVGEQTERAVVGLPVQQLETLLREATPGELILSREVHEELRETFAAAGYSLAPRRGVVTPLPLYVVSAQLAATVTGARPAVETPTGLLEAASLATLSGISPGSLMGRRFEILSVLGAGGMGVVYKARDRELDDLVALKMLKRDLLGDGAQLERLKSEIKLARKITHPNVLRTHDLGEIDGVPYISMEYVRGVTLRYMLDQSDRLPYSAGLRLAKQLCAGLGAAHAVGVIHRDIKPENLILEPTGNAKLMDFGIARPLERLSPGQTQAGMVVGTPQYMAPEIIQGREADVRSDLYSCGVVLYEIFTGRLPVTGNTAMEVCIKALRDEPEPPSSHWREIPPRLETMILRCLRKDPKERFRSTDELLQELAALSA